MAALNNLIIRTSDRNTFRSCRQLWDYRSPIRQRWEYSPGIEPLDFGIAIHAGLDIYYDPLRWPHSEAVRHVVQYESELAFLQHMAGWQKRLFETKHWENQKERHGQLCTLGLGMLHHYWMWAPKHDTKWKPVKSEIEFEVPIPVPDDLVEWLDKYEPDNISYEWDDQLKCTVLVGYDVVAKAWGRVYYQGRIDLIVEFSDGTYGILDHKSAAQFGQTEHLDLDTQTRSYAWACKKMLGLDIVRIIYSELRKDVPKPPQVLQSGMLSKNKSQKTTVEMYLAAIKERGHDLNWYADFLPKLAEKQTQYFRRTEVAYSAAELESTGRMICMEAIDMLSDPFIYPNPGRWNCNGCAFRTPCLMKQEGNDDLWHLRNSGLYVQKPVTTSTK